MSNKKTESVKYCTITATQDNTSISSADFLNLYYAINNTDYWSRGSTLIFATLNAGDSIYLKCIDFGVVNTCINIDCNKDVILSGNILSLVFGDNNSNETSLSNIKSGIGIASFSNVIKVSSDFLPSKELGAGCYESMFANCPRLTQAPELPATTLAPSCYRAMFNGCSNLNYIKMLATDISAVRCLHYWVYGVSPTGTFIKNKDATWDTTPGALGDSGVPAGWTVKTDDEESGGNSLFPATLIPTNEENLPNYNIAKYFVDNYPDMVIDISGAYTPITEDVTIEGSNYCDGNVIGVAKWVDGNSLLFYTENSISNWFALRVVLSNENTGKGFAKEYFFD